MKKTFRLLICFIMALLISGCTYFDTDVSDADYRRQIAVKEKYLMALNEISMNFMSSNIMIEVRHSSGILHTVLEVGQGSGVIFKQERKTGVYLYYVLTNNHVTHSSNSKVNYRECMIVDYMDNEIDAEILYEDASYDLAVITFESDTDYNVCEFATSDPKIGEGVFAIGQPLGQRNTITFGYVKDYDLVNAGESEIKFDCIYHDAYINSGNSGGVLLNGDIKLCGINFAVGQDIDGENIISISIPLSKVLEFLELNEITVSSVS